MTQTLPQRRPGFLAAVFGQLGWPLVWGLAVTVVFFALLQRGFIPYQALLTRYMAGHPIEYVESALFFIGCAALVIKLRSVLRQQASLRRATLPAPAAGGDRPEDCPQLLAALDELPAPLRDGYLVPRWRAALEGVQRKGDAAGLEDELRHLADADFNAQYAGFALVRLMIWAIPILGFLGTVIGITVAISGISPESFASTQGIDVLTRGLGVAFDTTAQALALSMVLMFAQFLIDRFEGELLTAIDRRTLEEFSGRFQELGTGTDPQLASIRKMAETVVQASESLVARQAELWQKTIDAAHEQWSRLSSSAAQQTQSAFETSLTRSLQTHAAQLTSSEQRAAERTGLLAEKLTGAVQSFAQVAAKQQAELVRQGEVLQRAIEAAGRVTQLQQALNNNLHALAGAKNFEDTVMSLAAAIHLLNARLGSPRETESFVRLDAAAKEQVVKLDSPAKDQQGRAA